MNIGSYIIKLISHRGNINGIQPNKENTQPYIQAAIDSGYDVEVDVWAVGESNQLYLGHDCPETETSLEWLFERRKSLWIHCKGFQALSFLIDKKLTMFFHEQESYTIISNGYIWAHNLLEINDKCVIPLLSESAISQWTQQPVYGVCSDYIQYLV